MPDQIEVAEIVFIKLINAFIKKKFGLNAKCTFNKLTFQEENIFTTNTIFLNGAIINIMGLTAHTQIGKEGLEQLFTKYY